MERYHSVHEEDIASFDLPSTHRLPTVSAAQALEDLDANFSRHVSTGLRQLDEALDSSVPLEKSSLKRSGGVPRGQVTEIWGPPGSGKTALGIQLVANALHDGHGAVWVDCAYSVCGHRLASVIRATEGSRPAADKENFTHYACPSLPHLVSLLCRPSSLTVPTNTALVVIDSLSALVNHAFPKALDGRNKQTPGKGPGPSAKRLQALQYLVSALQKLAATRDCAVVILSQCATKMQLEGSLTLIPSINAGVWEHGVSTRMVLFRDWIWKDGDPSTVGFAGVQKLDGKVVPDTMQSAAAFRVKATGLIGVDYDTSQPPPVLLSTTPRGKRKLAEAGLEVPDSDEDDGEYGWEQEDDAALPGMPPQWQGSEDLLLGTQAESDGSDSDDNDEKEVEEAAVSGRDNDK